MSYQSLPQIKKHLSPRQHPVTYLTIINTSKIATFSDCFQQRRRFNHHFVSQIHRRVQQLFVVTIRVQWDSNLGRDL